MRESPEKFSLKLSVYEEPVGTNDFRKVSRLRVCFSGPKKRITSVLEANSEQKFVFCGHDVISVSNLRMTSNLLKLRFFVFSLKLDRLFSKIFF